MMTKESPGERCSAVEQAVNPKNLTADRNQDGGTPQLFGCASNLARSQGRVRASDLWNLEIRSSTRVGPRGVVIVIEPSCCSKARVFLAPTGGAIASNFLITSSALKEAPRRYFDLRWLAG